MRISDWSSDVCSSDLIAAEARHHAFLFGGDDVEGGKDHPRDDQREDDPFPELRRIAQIELAAASARTAAAETAAPLAQQLVERRGAARLLPAPLVGGIGGHRSEEHTSELQSLMRISYAVFCLKKKIQN